MMWHQEDTFYGLFKRSFLDTFPGCEARLSLSKWNLNARGMASKNGQCVANCKSEWPNLCSPEWTLNFRIKVLFEIDITARKSKQKPQNGSLVHILNKNTIWSLPTFFFLQTEFWYKALTYANRTFQSHRKKRSPFRRSNHIFSGKTPQLNLVTNNTNNSKLYCNKEHCIELINNISSEKQDCQQHTEW